jgi:hypothetical protein
MKRQWNDLQGKRIYLFPLRNLNRAFWLVVRIIPYGKSRESAWRHLRTFCTKDMYLKADGCWSSRELRCPAQWSQKSEKPRLPPVGVGQWPKKNVLNLVSSQHFTSFTSTKATTLNSFHLSKRLCPSDKIFPLINDQWSVCRSEHKEIRKLFVYYF